MKSRFPLDLLTLFPLCSTLLVSPILEAKPSVRQPSASRPNLSRTKGVSASEVPPAGACGEWLDTLTARPKAIGPMLERRSDFQATAMDDRILITGGSENPTSEWFDPTTRTFKAGPAMIRARQGHRALRHSSGRLLVLGGTEAGSAPEILEVGASRFTAISGEARFSLAPDAIELADGRVLMIDGMSGKAWTWDIQKGVRSTGSPSTPRIFFALSLLADGKVLMSGGLPSEADAGRSPRRGFGRETRPVRKVEDGKGLSVEVFNPKWGSWSSWRCDVQPRARHAAIPSQDGKLYLCGGYGRDTATSVETVDLIDPAKETCTPIKKVALGSAPMWIKAPQSVGAKGIDAKGLLLPDGSGNLHQTSDPTQLGQPVTRLANAYLAPQLVPLHSGCLVLGMPVWGPSVERWDPRQRQSSIVGSLRADTEQVARLKDGRVLAIGSVVDLLDPRTGSLNPLGWREDLAALLKTIDSPKPLGSAPSSEPPFQGDARRKDYLIAPVAPGKYMIVGGSSLEDGKPSRVLEIWEPAKRSLVSGGTLKSARSFPATNGTQGSLILKDGSVLIYGKAVE